ncbi:MAG: hypothetical protein FJX80_04300 [Bacteroidetes bacterium]|nr:hypothetical protein [Bacteroidota bacterium]
MIFEERTLLSADVRRHHAFYSAIFSDIPFYEVFEVLESPLSYRIQNSLTRNAIVVQQGEPIESDRPLVSYSLNLMKDMSSVSSRIESAGGSVHREAQEIKPGIWALWGNDSLGQHFGLVCSSHE